MSRLLTVAYTLVLGGGVTGCLPVRKERRHHQGLVMGKGLSATVTALRSTMGIPRRLPVPLESKTYVPEMVGYSPLSLQGAQSPEDPLEGKPESL